jgi:hypothetical protein
MFQRIVGVVLAAALIVAFAAPGASALTAGPEFRVNTFITSDQWFPSVASWNDGSFVVVWQTTDQDGDGQGIYGRRYNAAGNPAGTEFRVNTKTEGDQLWPSVATLVDGGFVVVWNSFNGANSQVRAQRFNTAGTPIGQEFRANTTTAYFLFAAKVAALKDGGFVAVWTSIDQDGSGTGISGQRFDAAGRRAGAEFRVNTTTDNEQESPSVAVLGNGSFVVTWTSHRNNLAATDIHGQRFRADGKPLGPEFRVNTFRMGCQCSASVAALGEKDFVVTWSSLGQDGSGEGVYGQRYNAQGRAGAEFRVNGITAGDQGMPSVTGLGHGRFIVVYSNFNGSHTDIHSQRFRGGSALGPEFRVNTTRPDSQDLPVVAALGKGGFVVVWMADNQDGAGYGIYGRRYTNTTP